MIKGLLIAITCILASACGPDDRILKSGKETPAPSNVEASKPTFEKELDEIKSAGFTFVYVLRRKDGQKLDAEDRGVIRLQTADMNRRITADEDKAVIIGSNYQLPSKNMMTILDRFAVENHSLPVPAVDANSNANK
ncbi:MAG: hypothetical protein IPO41_04510 [Acidobacteria bacterium]|nr:hypothetical protein [Acidobacteriota bacterium]MBP7474635.1 hypothetical protein [Pyrinomonadaceae bacterium]